MMNSSDIREKFLKYFEGHGHARVPSSPLIPPGDPTLFFTNAGMVQFKDVFLGQEKRPFKRATSSQKCIRVSGKHNDLEEVGLTTKHHTFFEMLGNFSFGDYFKKEAVAYAWEFLTKVIGLPKDRLWVTIYNDDDEAENIWRKHVTRDRIFRFGEKDNFWAMGETGPCGPCSEIHYDPIGHQKITKKDFDGFMEVWNLVFMQFERDAGGNLPAGKAGMHKLVKPSIDTGMGLERLAAIIQEVQGNYETDLFMPIIVEIERVTGKRYTRSYLAVPAGRQVARDSSLVTRTPSHTLPLQGGGAGVGVASDERRATSDDFSIRVIADHIRASTFLIADGVYPSNEGRGYVLRRIIRRAIRHGKKLGMDRPFFAPIAHIVIDQMGTAYPELIQHQKTIEKVLAREEEGFYNALSRGLDIIEELCDKYKDNKVISGGDVFKLYDTYGFPKDLTANIVAERGFSIDETGFERLMSGQKERARSHHRGGVETVYKGLIDRGIKTKFVGYEKASCEAKVVAIIDESLVVSRSSLVPTTNDQRPATIQFITNITPFYGETGGQVGDTGMAVGEGLEIVIDDAKRPAPNLIVHIGRIQKGKLEVGDKITLAIDGERRADIRRNHTATHLLHKALREVLGEHVRQAGSLVEPGRLRFDFNHFEPLSEEQVVEIERAVNEVIRRNLSVHVSEMPYRDAVARGALAFFDEKYGATVRVVEVEGYSIELCGGTHVSRTGDIGMLKIISESSIAQGVRRVEAVTGRGAEEYVSKMEEELDELCATFKVGRKELKMKLKKLMEETGRLEKELKAAKGTVKIDLMSQVKTVNGVNVLAVRVDAGGAGDLRSLLDQYKQKVGSGIVALGCVANEKVHLVVGITPDLVSRYNAGELIKKLSGIVGGTGGGRADFAQGGGTLIEKLDEALAGLQDALTYYR